MVIELITRDLQAGLDEEIDLFIETHPFRTVFQSPAFYSFYLKQAYFEPFYLLSRDAAGDISGVLLGVFITEGKGLLGRLSRRCVVYGGPLVKNDDLQVLKQLLGGLNKHATRRALFTQFRNFRGWDSAQQEVFTRFGFVLRNRLNLLVAIGPGQDFKRGFSEVRRRQLKKALHQGVVVREAESLRDIENLYVLLSKLYKEKVKKPIPKIEFFYQFFEWLVPQGKGVVLLVELSGELIGGIVAPITPGWSISELYVCGLDKEYPNAFPSVVATWAAMDYGQKRGLHLFDFMGLGVPEVPYGVRDFKLRFGGEQVNYGRFGRRNNRFLYGIAEFGYNIWRRVR